MNNPLAGTDPSGYVAEEITKKIKVSTTGSRIQRTVTVSASDAGNDGANVTISGGNGASRDAVKGAITKAASSAGLNVTDIGGQQEVAKQFSSSGDNSTNVTYNAPDALNPMRTREEGDLSRDEMRANKKELEGKLSVLEEVRKITPGSYKFTSEEDAAKAILGITAPLSAKYGLEIGGEIYEKNNMFAYSSPRIGSTTGMTLDLTYSNYHTHPKGMVSFSTIKNGGRDVPNVNSKQLNPYNRNSYIGQQLKSGKVYVGVCKPGTCDSLKFIERGARVY
tara:strand:- start:771 stop:1607 length:837 start_codon:yes stop_codon:yes gene_type:complete